MDETDFASLSHGVFVIPFRPDNEVTPTIEAGPSRDPRPLRKLQKVYKRDCQRVQAAQEAYEKELVDSRLDDVRDWLEACDRPPLLNFGSRTTRLKIAVLQSNSVDISSHVVDLAAHTFTLHGREVSDLASAIRDVTTGLSDGAVSYTKTSGTAGLDALERHMRKQKQASHLLLHVAQAQSLPQGTLSGLLYVLSRHTSLPLRVILSVPSASLFVSSLRHIDPTAVDVSILRSSGSKRRNGVAESLYKSLSEPNGTPLLVSQATVEELQAKEHETGGGVLGAVKALKWLLLRASESSRLATLVEDDDLAALQGIVDASRDSNDGALAELLDPEAPAAQEAALDPAPRPSILKALSDYQLFLKVMGEDQTPSLERNDLDTGLSNGLNDKGGRLDEVQRLFELYASAGRTVNLWDWLQGFEDSVARAKASKDSGVEGNGDEDVDDGGEPSPKRKRRDNGSDERDDGENAAPEGEEEEEEPKIVDETEQDRLHSTFIRFCEEARMMGLLRARGRGKADEVVKGIGFV